MLQFWKKLFNRFLKDETVLFRPRRFAILEDKLGYEFRNPELLKRALIHRSYLPGTGRSRVESNERLEFLGDAVLGLIVTEFLFRKFPDKSEGMLTQYKSILVSRKLMAQIARRIGLGDFIFLGSGEKRSGGRHRASINSNAMEAVFGAVYLDGGFEAAEKVIENLILCDVETVLSRELDRNYKSQLLEKAQASGMGIPEYVVQSARGPEHAKIFEVAVKLKGNVMGTGTGKTKKMAEQNAAQQALENLN